MNTGHRLSSLCRLLAVPALTLVFAGNSFASASSEVDQFLKNVPGLVNLKEDTSPFPGTRFFTFEYMQPVDHENPTGSSFPVRATLLYRSATAPMVIYTRGYSLYAKPHQSEPTRLLSANQLSLEHRYFESSTPKPLDWSYLNIYQSASDSHRITEAFKPFFTGTWLNTGGSKGGMTAVYHRYFYPEDVDCTVAYVAPHSYSRADERYVSYVENLGSVDVSLGLEAWQQRALDKKPELMALIDAIAKKKGLDFSGYSGGLEMGLEWYLLEAPFVAWHNGDSVLAKSFPTPGASASDHLAYLDKIYHKDLVGGMASGPKEFAAYNFQAATQLGAPANKESHLKGLKFPGTDSPQNNPPFDESKPYECESMELVQKWVDEEAEQMIFVYGSNDPWTAAAYEVTEAAEKRGVKKFIQPEGNHGACIRGLPRNLFNECTKLLAEWMGTETLRSYEPDFKLPAEEMRLLRK